MTKRTRILRATLLTGLLLWAVPVRGDAGDEKNDPPGTLDDFIEYVEVRDFSLPTSNTIATKLTLPLQLTPANVGTVGGPLLYEQDASTLSDALKNVSGLNVQNGSGVHDFFVIRGFDSISSGLVMTDGASEPEVGYYQLYNVQGVEVFKGPAGFLYGRNPLAGAVNIVRKQPLPGNFSVFGGSFGSYGTYEGTIDWNVAPEDGAASFRLNGLWHESENYRDDKGSRHAAVNPSLTWKLGGRSTLNFNAEYVDAEYRPDNGLPLSGNAIPDVPRRRSYQSPSDFSDQQLGRFQVDLETRISDRLTLRNKTYYRDLDWKTEGTLLSGTAAVVPGEVEVLRDLARLDDRQRFVGSQFEAVLTLGTGSVRHNLLAGLEVVRESDEYTFDILPLVDVELFGLEERNLLEDLGLVQPLVPLNSVGDVTNVIVAPYLADQIELSSKFELLLGARYDEIDSDGKIRPLGFPGEVSFSRDDSKLSPMAGLVYAPGESLSLYANAGRSYAPPSTRLVDEFLPENREPEKGSQVEVGAKKQFRGGKVRTTLALYELERERIAILGADGFTQQAGDQRSRGVELEIAAEPLPRLRTFFSYAYNDAELTEFVPCVRVDAVSCVATDYSGNTPIMAPKHLANFWISKSFANGFGIGGGGRFVDEQFISEDNLFRIDSYVVLDATVFYDLKNWRLKLNLKNLTDEDYETRGIAGATSVIPANPFSAYASVEFRM